MSLYHGWELRPIPEVIMEKKVGEVTHFFAGPSAAVLRLSSDLKVGDEIHIVGFTTDLNEKVTSMQINHTDVNQAGPGDDVAILVKDRVREGDEVFLAEKEAMPSAPKALAPMAPALAPGMPSMPMATPKPAAPKPAPKPAAKAPAKAKAKPKAKAKAKAKPKAKKKPAKSKAKAKKAKPKAKAKAKAKAKPKKKSRR
jgi:translation elongation factor EF-1alpha